MSVASKIIAVAALSLGITMAVMASVSRLPGLQVPLAWWIVGIVLPLAISVPVTYLMTRQSADIHRLNAELMRAYEAVKHAAETDHLTGIANRAAFDARVAALHQLASGWFLVVDIDHFKAVNDRNGHAVGDAALVAVAGALCEMVGPDDIVARIGGEEFAVFQPTADADTAVATAEAIRRAVAALSVKGKDGRPIALTVSIGLRAGSGLSIADGLSHADQAMYGAKQAGRDRVHISE
ncbi:GGDEF domain-containing protein [Pseudanabaena biceps]|nr:GGDEF domain-containing protein [Pseudanabaena biceps]